MSSSNPLIILITGANAGLGYHAVKKLLSNGNNHHILVGARSIEKAQGAIKQFQADHQTDHQADQISSLEALEIDLNSDASIKAAAAYVEKTHGKLDILINNAGISGSLIPEASKREKWNSILDTNVVGTALVTDAFIPLLKKSKSPKCRIVNVSSPLGSLTLMTLGKLPVYQIYDAYSISKSAVNMLTLYTANRLKDDGITVFAITPTYCATNLNNNQGTSPPEDGGTSIARGVTAESGFDSALHGLFLGERPGVFYPY